MTQRTVTVLDAAAVRRWSAAAVDALAEHQAEIDELNVFPVPDGDTGTNLTYTLRAAAEALTAGSADTAGAALSLMARGAVLGARGNAGVIVSQILRGIADAADDPQGCGGPHLMRGLRAATEHAYAAVAEPLEGTILSVLRAAADAAEQVSAHDLADVLTTALTAASEALRHTPEQLPVLARAGVVDAGGRGFVVLLGSLATVVIGTDADMPAATPPGVRGESALRAVREAGSDRYGYEVQYLLQASDEQVAGLRNALSAIGDSVVVAGTGEDLWKIHVHVNDVGAAIESGIEAGQLSRITVVRFDDQLTPSVSDRSGVALVAVAPGEALAHLFAGEGVHVVEGDNPAVAEVLDAILGTHAAQVTLLPNAGQASGVVDAAAREARLAGVEVAVVPTRSPVQGLAAVAVHDGRRDFHDDVIAMAEAAAATRWSEVTVAAREALTSVGRCQPGDVLGLIAGEVVEIGSSVRSVGRAVVDRLLGSGGELLTVLVGADASSDDVEALEAHLSGVHPLVEVSVFQGGQPRYPLLIGVE